MVLIIGTYSSDFPLSTAMKDDKTFYVVAFVPIELKQFNEHGFVWSQVLQFTFKQMMTSFQSQGFNLNVQLRVLDTRNQVDVTTTHILNSLFEQISDEQEYQSCCDAKPVSEQILGFIGPASSSVVDRVFDLLASDHYPVISYSATSVRFDNKERYPTFFRMIPPDNIQAQLMLDLMLLHNWTYVGIVVHDDEYGRMGMSELKRLLSPQSVCTAIEAVVDIDAVNSVRKIVQQLKNDSKVHVIVLWMDGVRIRKFFQVAQEMQLYNKTLILCESASELAAILDYDTRVTRGLLSIVPNSGVYDDFETHFRHMTYRSDGDRLTKRFFEEALRVNPSMIDRGVSVDEYWDKVPTAKNGFVYNSLRAFGEALKSFVQNHPRLCSYQNTTACLKVINQNRLSFINDYLKNISFVDLQNNAISFDTKGNTNSSRFLISTVQTRENGTNYWKRVGHWTTTKGLKISETFVWSNGKTVPPPSNCGKVCFPGFKHRNGSTACCWTCVPCQNNRVKREFGAGTCEPCPLGTHANKERSECIVLQRVDFDYSSDFGIALLVVTSFNMCAILIVVIVFVLFKKTPVVISSNFVFSMTQLFFLAMLNLVALISLFKLNKNNCVIYGVMLPFITTMAILPTIFKTQQLNRIFKSKRILTHKRFHGDHIILSVALLLLQTALVVVYTSFGSLNKTKEKIDYNTKEISINCYLNSFIYLQLAFVFLVLLVCGISAFKARELPHNYNETRVIAYSMFTNCVILIFIIPLFISLPPEWKNRAVIFGINLIDTNMILFMYSHKVWIILFCPKLNTAENFAMSRLRHINENVSSFCSRYGVSSVENSPCSSSNLVMARKQINVSMTLHSVTDSID